MTLVRWQPLREIDSLQRQLDRIFNDSIFSTEDWGDLSNFPAKPAVELTEKDDAFMLKLEVPGLNSDDIDIQVTQNTVSISGERRYEKTSDANGTLHSEFRYGKFQRAISLPSRIQNQNVIADYTDGILQLTLPKTEDEKHKVVKVNVNGQAVGE